MTKKLLNALLCGAVILSAGVFTSCKTDLTEIETKIRAWETWRANIEAQLATALKTGQSITDHTYDANTKVHSFTLSGGEKFTIGGAGGSDVTVDIKDGFAVITVNGKPYTLPMGSAVNSLVYRPEFEDGLVMLGNGGAKVRFLATPAVSAEALAKASFDLADVYPVKARTRAGNGGLIVVNGAATLTGDGYIEVPIKGIEVAAGTKYSASMQMSISGTTISSDYFTVEVTGDFSFKAEELDANIKPKADFTAALNDDGSYSVTVDGMDMIGVYDFAAMFEGVPAGAVYKIAAAAKQPGGKARDKQAMLARSLKADGKFEFAERPGTVFGDGDDSTPEKRKGFLVTVTQDWVVKAKAYIVITDPLAGVDFKGGLTENTEPEYGARWKFLGKGPGELDFQPTFLSIGVETDKQFDWEIIHAGREGFFGKWASFNVSAGDTNIIFHNGEKLAQADNDFVKKITTKSEGLYWFCKGICIDVPENFPEDFVYTKTDGTTVPRGKRIMDFGGPNPGEVSTSTHSPGYGWSTKYTWDRVAEFGVSITKDGVLKFTEAYGGHGLRLTLGAQFEYFYGARYLGFKNNQFGFFFFNRRISPEGATLPAGL